MTGNWWRYTVLHQMSRSPATAAVVFTVAADGTQIITFPKLNWAWFTISLAAVLSIGIALIVLIDRAQFDDPVTPAPNPPASCQLFCPEPT